MGKNQKNGGRLGLVGKGNYGSKCTGGWDVVILWGESQPMTLDGEFVKEDAVEEAGQRADLGSVWRS